MQGLDRKPAYRNPSEAPAPSSSVLAGAPRTPLSDHKRCAALFLPPSITCEFQPSSGSPPRVI